MKRRRPDGTPEVRSLDDLLAEVAHDEDVARLPGRGRPLDLHGYCHADPETRVANRLLRDHGVLPLPLQDRREVEDLVARAAADTEAAARDLARWRHAAEEALTALADRWPAQVPPAEAFGALPVPAALTAAAGRRPLDRRRRAETDACAAAKRWAEAATRHARRRSVHRRRVEEAAVRAESLCRRIREASSLSRALPLATPAPRVEAAAQLAAFDARCAEIDAAPEDLAERLARLLREHRPPWWRRWRPRRDAPTS